MSGDTSYAGQGQWDYSTGPGIWQPGTTRSQADPGIYQPMPGSVSYAQNLYAGGYQPGPPLPTAPQAASVISGYSNPNLNTTFDPTIGSDAQARVWATQQLTNQGMVLNAPAFAQFDINKSNDQFKIDQLLAQQGVETGYLNEDFSLGNRRLDIKEQGTQTQRDLANQLHDIAGRGFDLSRRENVAREQASQFQLFNEGVGKGNLQMGGYGVQRDQLAQQLARQQEGVGLSQEEETAKTNAQLKLLDQEAAGHGLDREQLQNELERGLQRLNLNTTVSVRDLFDAMQSNDQDRAMLANKIKNDAWNASDGPMKDLYPGSDPTMYDLQSTLNRSRK